MALADDMVFLTTLTGTLSKSNLIVKFLQALIPFTYFILFKIINGYFIYLWNSNYATSEVLRKRDDYEKKMMTLLEMNVVESWEHFKSFLDRLE